MESKKLNLFMKKKVYLDCNGIEVIADESAVAWIMTKSLWENYTDWQRQLFNPSKIWRIRLNAALFWLRMSGSWVCFESERNKKTNAYTLKWNKHLSDSMN